mgnify:CR=1 FL=1
MRWIFKRNKMFIVVFVLAVVLSITAIQKYGFKVTDYLRDRLSQFSKGAPDSEKNIPKPNTGGKHAGDNPDTDNRS